MLPPFIEAEQRDGDQGGFLGSRKAGSRRQPPSVPPCFPPAHPAGWYKRCPACALSWALVGGNKRDCLVEQSNESFPGPLTKIQRDPEAQRQAISRHGGSKNQAFLLFQNSSRFATSRSLIALFVSKISHPDFLSRRRRRSRRRKNCGF